MNFVLAPGSIFARDFQVLAPIASGGMGALYCVEQLSTRKRRALKVLRANVGSDPRAHQRFVREATVGAHIHSEHIVEVLAAGIDETTKLPWLAMELLDGLDLARIVARSGPIGPARSLEMFAQLGHGLGAAHDAGVVHRDLKPENVFVARSEREGAEFTVKILDFGIAKFSHDAAGVTDTASVGSPLWMSPEQINAGSLSVPTDIWALGLVAFWCLTGKIYWRAAHSERVTVQSLFAEQLFGELPPASIRAQELGAEALPYGFDAWFARCVDRDPLARFDHASPAIKALRSVLDSVADSDPLAAEPLLGFGGGPQSGQTLEAPILGRGGGARLVATGESGLGDEIEASRKTNPWESVDAGLAAVGVTDEQSSSPGPSAVDSPVPARIVVDDPAPRPPAVRLLRVAVGLVGGLAVGGLAWWGFEAWRDRSAAAPGVRQSGPVSETPATPRSSPTRTDVAFEGWTHDGDTFVLGVTYRPGDAAALPILEVHAALGGERLEHFLGAPSDASTVVPPSLRRLVASAGTLEAGQARVHGLALAPPVAHRVSPYGNGEIEVVPVPAGAADHLTLEPTATGFAFRWSASEHDKPPALAVEYVHATGRERVAMARLAVVGGSTPSQAGEFNVHWSPAADRFVVVFAEHLVPEGERAARWFLRAAGPQIRLVDAGAGRELTRRTAAILGQAGFPVARLEQAGEIRTDSTVYYVEGDAAPRDRAEAIAGAIGIATTVAPVTLAADDTSAFTVVLGRRE